MASSSPPPSPPPEFSAEEAQEPAIGATGPVGTDPPPEDLQVVDETADEPESPSVIPKYSDRETSDDLFLLPAVAAEVTLPVRVDNPPPSPEVPVIDLYDPGMHEDVDQFIAAQEPPNQRRRSHGRRRHRPTEASEGANRSRSGARGTGRPSSQSGACGTGRPSSQSGTRGTGQSSSQSGARGTGQPPSRSGASGTGHPPSRSSTQGSGYRYPPPRHEPLPPSHRRVTMDSRGGAAAVRVALPVPAPAPSPEAVLARAERDPHFAGVRARKRRAADNYRELNIPPGGPGTSNLRDRPGEAQLDPVFEFPKDMKYTPMKDPPAELDLDQQTRREHMWRPLRADRQTVKVPYYEVRTPVNEASQTDVRLFNSIDVFLPYFFARLYRYRWVLEGDDSDLGPNHETVLQWQAQYQHITRTWSNAARVSNPDREARDLAIEVNRRWAAIRTAVSITYVLRRASLEPAFRELLLRLPRLGATVFTGTSRLLGEDYAAILREVQVRLAQNLRDPVGGMSYNLLLGDSHLVPLNWMQGSEGLVPGRVFGFAVHGYSGANTRSITWLTQALISPATRRVAWVIGTNDAELVPPPTKDDRPAVERRLAPRREDPSGRPRLVTYAQLAFAVAYPARLIRSLFPTLGGLFVFEIPPRFDFLGMQQIEWRAFSDVLRHPVNIQLWKANALLHRLITAEPRIHVLALFDRLYEPSLYWRGPNQGYNQHPDMHVLYQALSFAFQWVRALGPGDEPDNQGQ